MRTLRWSAITLIALSTLLLLNGTLSTAVAQTNLEEAQAASLSITVQGDLARFTTRTAAARQIRIEVYDSNNDLIFNSGVVTGKVAQWNLLDEQGRPVPDGIYNVVLTIVNGKKSRTGLGQLRVVREQPQPQRNSNPPAPAPVDGGGTPDRIAKWTGPHRLSDSVINEYGNRIGIGTLRPSAVLHVDEKEPPPSATDGTPNKALLHTTGGKGGDTTGAGFEAGSGAGIALYAGNGGNAPAGSANGRGGNITLQPGLPGAGAGSAGRRGNIYLAPFNGHVGIGTVAASSKLTIAHGNLEFLTPSMGIKFSDGSLQTTAGLQFVTHDSTLTGDGTNANPLGVALPLSLSNSSSTPTLTVSNGDAAGVGVLGVHSATTGTGAGVRGETNSTDMNAVGVLGIVNPTNPGDLSAGVRGINNGTGAFGIGVYGSQAGSGWGVFGTTPSGIGVRGESAGGTGVYGLSINGKGGSFEITNNANNNDALTGATGGGGAAIRGLTTGAGRAGFFEINNAANSATALQANSNGTGRAGLLQLTNASNSANALEALTAGTGNAVLGKRGAGSLLALPFTPAVRGDNTDGPGVAGTGGSGVGVYGTSSTSHGVWGVSVGSNNVGVYGRNDFNGIGVKGESLAGGTGVYGISSNGSAGTFEITNTNSIADALSVNQSGNGEGVISVINKSSNTNPALRGETSGSGSGVHGLTTGTGNAGSFEIDNSSSNKTAVHVKSNGTGSGLVIQLTNGSNGARGIDVIHSGNGPGVFATTRGNALWGIAENFGAAGAIGDNTRGGEGVVGRNKGCFNGNTLVLGCNNVGASAVTGRNDGYGAGVYGFVTGDFSDGIIAAVLGRSGVASGRGNAGRFENINASNPDDALLATTRGGGRAAYFTITKTDSTANALEVEHKGLGRAAYFTATNTGNTANALEVENKGTGKAAKFIGNVEVMGDLSVTGAKAFKIDHPLDPANKYLYHAAVESPDMMNIYNGNVTTDARGQATVTMPSYFQALNRDFRYQLTVIGQFAQAIVFEEIKDNQFKIKTNKPRVKVSWQVTGIRQDAWADAHRLQVEQEKTGTERGTYTDPELYRQPASNETRRAQQSTSKRRATRGQRSRRHH